jgi:hypothetical protein
MSLEKSSGLRGLLAVVAGPREWTDTRESWLNRAARRAGISFRQAKACFYNEHTNPNSPSARKLRDAAAKAGVAEARALAEQFETIARALDAADADFFSSDRDALLHAAGVLRRVGVARIADGEG